MDSKEQNKQTNKTETKNSLMVSEEKGMWEGIQKVKGVRTTNWWSQNCPVDINYSIGNLVNNIVITMYSAR